MKRYLLRQRNDKRAIQTRRCFKFKIVPSLCTNRESLIQERLGSLTPVREGSYPKTEPLTYMNRGLFRLKEVGRLDRSCHKRLLAKTKRSALDRSPKSLNSKDLSRSETMRNSFLNKWNLERLNRSHWFPWASLKQWIPSQTTPSKTCTITPAIDPFLQSIRV